MARPAAPNRRSRPRPDPAARVGQRRVLVRAAGTWVGCWAAAMARSLPPLEPGGIAAHRYGRSRESGGLVWSTWFRPWSPPLGMGNGGPGASCCRLSCGRSCSPCRGDPRFGGGRNGGPGRAGRAPRRRLNTGAGFPHPSGQWPTRGGIPTVACNYVSFRGGERHDIALGAWKWWALSGLFCSLLASGACPAADAAPHP